MPFTPKSCLLVKISSSQYGPGCPPVIIKEKDGSLRAQQRHQHASLLLCSECSTLSNPPAPDGLIYCTKWIVFWLHSILPNVPLIPSLFLPAPAPLSLSLVLTKLVETAELSDRFTAGVTLLKGSAG